MIQFSDLFLNNIFTVTDSDYFTFIGYNLRDSHRRHIYNY